MAELVDHDMTADRHPSGVVLTCGSCGRQVGIAPGKFDVIVKGDYRALHRWTSDPDLSMGVGEVSAA